MTRPPERRFFALFMGFWLPVLLYLSLIYWLSAQPHLQVPLHFRNSDKVAHVAEYLVLGLLTVRALRATLRVSRPLFAALMAIAFVMLAGASDEYHQSFVPGRTCDFFDFVADTVGGTLAQFLYVFFVKG